MKYARFILLAACCFTLASCGSPNTTSSFPRAPGSPKSSPDLRSNLGIPASQEFLFAGGSSGSFRASAFNNGQTAFEIFSERDGVRTAKALVEPGQSAFASFVPGETAIFVNTSSTVDANCQLLVWGDTNVGMRYRDWLTRTDTE